MSEAPARPGRNLWHGSVRGRLAGATALLLAVFGAVALGLVYLGMRYLTSYQLTPAAAATNPPVTSTGGVTVTAAATTADPLRIIVVSSPGGVVSTLLVIGAVALAVTVALGAVAAWLLARRFLRPLDSLARASAAFGGWTWRTGRPAPGTTTSSAR